MKILLEYINLLLREEYQSHTFEPRIGDMVSNINSGCKHYNSQGEVLDVKDLPRESGKIIVYRVSNNGENFSIGDVLEKTMDQLAPRKEL